MAAEILASAFVAEGKHVAAFPMFSFERRGAPMQSFVRFDDKPIREKTQIYLPDVVIILDPALATSPGSFWGLKSGGVVVANRPKPYEEPPDQNAKLGAVVEATEIALTELGIPATNTPMLGAFAAATHWVGIESILSGLDAYFSGELLKKNMRCVERAFHEVEISQWQ